jgi:hypothetical protein
MPWCGKTGDGNVTTDDIGICSLADNTSDKGKSNRITGFKENTIQTTNCPLP